MFKCEWYDPSSRQGTQKHNNYDITEVNVTRKYRHYDPFILPQNVRQVYFLPYRSSCKSSSVVVVKTKTRCQIKSDDRIEGQEPYHIDDPTPSEIVVDTVEHITLSSASMDDDIIDLGLHHDAIPQQDDYLQKEDDEEDLCQFEFLKNNFCCKYSLNQQWILSIKF
ncbi:uncharacterized protein DS421_20g701510 [Arachis hypogaea]|nr:uncharacterized protein DS421_20g701510 [Arachis hypogaea]